MLNLIYGEVLPEYNIVEVGLRNSDEREDGLLALPLN